MILNCSKCATRYLVTDTAIGDKGRMVRCANCGYSWFQAPAWNEDIPEIELQRKPPPVPPFSMSESVAMRKRPLPPGSNLPVVVVMHIAPNWLKRLCVVLLSLIVILTPFAYRQSLMYNHPVISLLFEPFGIYHTDGLALADITLNKVPDENAKVTRVTLNCNVINEAKGNRTLPAVAAALLDAGGKTIAVSSNLADTGKNMISGDIEPCQPFTFETRNNQITQVRLDLVDRFDYSLRRK